VIQSKGRWIVGVLIDNTNVLGMTALYNLLWSSTLEETVPRQNVNRLVMVNLSTGTTMNSKGSEAGCVWMDSVLIDDKFIGEIAEVVKQSKSSYCTLAEFTGIMAPHLTDSECRQLFALYKQVFPHTQTLSLSLLMFPTSLELITPLRVKAAFTLT